MNLMQSLLLLALIATVLTALVIRRVVIWCRSRDSPKPRGPMDEPVWVNGQDVILTERQLCQGVLTLGQTGSGKSSGVISNLLRSVFLKGYGACLIAPKPGDAQQYLKLARECGRQAVVLDDSAKHRLSFVRTLLRGKGSAATLAALGEAGLTTISQVVGEEEKGGSDSTFWVAATKNLVRHLFLPHLQANVEPTPRALMSLLNSIPQSPQERAAPEFRQSYCYRLLDMAQTAAKANGDVEDFRATLEFHTETHPRLSPRTRSVIEACVQNALAPLLTGIGAEVLAGEPTFDLAELVTSNGILIVDFPLAYYQEIGKAIGACAKFLCQREAMQRRGGKPFVICLDEGANYLTSFDYEYVSISRSFKAPMVVSLQCVSQLARSEGDTQRAKTLSGNLANIIACSSTPTTAEWLSQIIGKERQFFVGGSVGASDFDPFAIGRSTATGSFSEQMTERVRPESLRFLKSGGEECGLEVEALLLQPSREHRFITLKQG